MGSTGSQERQQGAGWWWLERGKLFFWNLDPVDKKGVNVEGDGERRVLISVHGCCEGHVAKKERAKQGAEQCPWTVEGRGASRAQCSRD